MANLLRAQISINNWLLVSYEINSEYAIKRSDALLIGIHLEAYTLVNDLYA